MCLVVFGCVWLCEHVFGCVSLLLEADLLLELGISISKFGKFFPATDREDFNSSKESTISTSLIHSIASDGKSEQVVP